MAHTFNHGNQLARCDSCHNKPPDVMATYAAAMATKAVAEDALVSCMQASNPRVQKHCKQTGNSRTPISPNFIVQGILIFVFKTF